MAAGSENPQVRTLYKPQKACSPSDHTPVLLPRFGVQPNGAMYENVTSWVCMSYPLSGTVTYNCVPEVGL